MVFHAGYVTSGTHCHLDRTLCCRAGKPGMRRQPRDFSLRISALSVTSRMRIANVVSRDGCVPVGGCTHNTDPSLYICRFAGTDAKEQDLVSQTPARRGLPTREPLRVTHAGTLRSSVHCRKVRFRSRQDGNDFLKELADRLHSPSSRVLGLVRKRDERCTAWLERLVYSMNG